MFDPPELFYFPPATNSLVRQGLNLKLCWRVGPVLMIMLGQDDGAEGLKFLKPSSSKGRVFTLTRGQNVASLSSLLGTTAA